jgi:hypothetical protein
MPILEAGFGFGVQVLNSGTKISNGIGVVPRGPSLTDGWHLCDCFASYYYSDMSL